MKQIVVSGLRHGLIVVLLILATVVSAKGLYAQSCTGSIMCGDPGIYCSDPGDPTTCVPHCYGRAGTSMTCGLYNGDPCSNVWEVQGCGENSCEIGSCNYDPPGGGGSSSASPSPSPSPTPVTCSYSSCNTDLNTCQLHSNQTECGGGGCSCYSNSCTIDDDCLVTKLEVISRTVDDPNATCGQIAAAGVMGVATNVHIVGPGGSNVNGNYGISPTQYTLDNATVGNYAIGQGSSTPSGYDATPIFCNGGSRSVGSINAAVTQDDTTTVYAAFVRRGNLNIYAKGISVAPALMTCNNF